MTETTRQLIRDYGEEAYPVAVRLTVWAAISGDQQGAELFAASARELLQSGYHKKTAEAPRLPGGGGKE
jgi:hypothetical protein